MAGGGLFDPLGMDRSPSVRPVIRVSVPMIAAGAAVAVLASLLAVAWFHDDGDRGRAQAVSPIMRAEAPPKLPPAPVALPVPPAAPAQAPMQSGLAVRDDQEVEIQNGVRVIRPRRDRGMPAPQPMPVPGNLVSVPRSTP